MPTPPTAKWPKPRSEDEFEDIVLDALRTRWRDPNASRNGRRGQRQRGIDIVGQAHHRGGLNVGAQCKNTDSPTLAQVIKEVAKAEGFQPALAEFLFVTVADRDAKLQEQVRVHFGKHPARFRVEVVFWDDLVHEISGNSIAVAKHWQGWRATGHETVGAVGAPITSPGQIRLHVIAKSLQAPDYSPSRVVLRFSITNLSIEPVKLTQLTLHVDRRLTYPRIRIPDVGAPCEEFSLQADIRHAGSVDALADAAVQFVLRPQDTDAFRLECIGHGGVRYSCRLEAVALGLRSCDSHSSAVEGIDLAFPAHSADDLLRMKRGDL